MKEVPVPSQRPFVSRLFRWLPSSLSSSLSIASSESSQPESSPSSGVISCVKDLTKTLLPDTLALVIWSAGDPASTDWRRRRSRRSRMFIHGNLRKATEQGEEGNQSRAESFWEWSLAIAHRIAFISHFAMNACRQSYLRESGLFNGDDNKLSLGNVAKAGFQNIRAICYSTLVTPYFNVVTKME